METFTSRIFIQYEQGALITFLYNRESFNLLKIEREQFDNSQFIIIGQIIEYEGKKFKVKSIIFKMDEKLNKMNSNVGFNLSSSSDVSNYNCQIGILVDDVE